MTDLIRHEKKTVWEKYGILLLFAVFSALLLSVCSMCSFLFPIHNRVDQNVFFTVGREMLNGKVIYRDMFEHKGPLTYFIHAAAALISASSFIGMYLIEILCLTVFMIFAYKTALFFTGKITAFCAVLTSVTIMLCSNCFLRGDNVEELCWPFLMISIYYYLRGVPLKYNLSPKAQTPFVIFLNGLLFGAVLWIKFNLVGYWIGWVFITFLPLLQQKNIKRFFAWGGIFLAGAALTALPWIIYFTAKGALYDFLYTYFYCNIFLYKESVGIGSRLISILIGVGRNLIGNVVLIAVSLYGLIRFCKLRMFAPLITYLGLYAGVFFGGRWYDYYYLVLAFYVLFGIVFVFEDLKELHLFRLLRSHAAAGSLLVLLLCLGIAVPGSNCYPYYGAAESEYPQYQFAEYIRNSGIQNPTLLNYGFIDQGFFLAADISPINKYFCRVNIPYSALPEMYEQQRELIDNKRVDFVVVRMIGRNSSIPDGYIESITVAGTYNYQNPSYVISPEQVPLLFENYELVMQSSDLHDAYTFGLFQKK